MKGVRSHAGGTRVGGERTTIRDEIRCEKCGYGAVVGQKPTRCPMCGNKSWIGVGSDSALRPAQS